MNRKKVFKDGVSWPECFECFRSYFSRFSRISLVIHSFFVKNNFPSTTRKQLFRSCFSFLFFCQHTTSASQRSYYFPLFPFASKLCSDSALGAKLFFTRTILVDVRPWESISASALWKCFEISSSTRQTEISVQNKSFEVVWD